MKKIIGLSIITILLVSFISSFIEIGEKEILKENDSFTFSINKFEKNLKQVGNLDKRLQDIICATSRGLIEIDENNDIVSSLSEGADIRDNGLEYSFKIKDNIYWSDGSKIESEDILSFFREIIIEEKEENIIALLNVYGAREYRNNKKAIFSETVGIQVRDNELIFRLNSKDDDFIKELSKVQYRLRKNIILWEDIERNYSNLVYSGNYKIESINSGEINLKSNNSNVEIEKIKLIMGEESEIAMAAFEIGNRDIVLNPPKSQLGRLKTENKLISTDSETGIYLSYNKDYSLEDRKNIYYYMLKSMENYQINNSSYIDLAEGSYIRSDKDDLNKLQERKVMANNLESETKIEELYFAARDNVENKDILEYTSKWFLENADIYIDYDLLSEEEFQRVKNNNYYDLILFESNISSGRGLGDYEDFLNLLSSEYRDKIKGNDSYYISKEILSLDEVLYNNFEIMPLAFLRTNIATNNTNKVNFDIHGNINFNKIEKS